MKKVVTLDFAAACSALRQQQAVFWAAYDNAFANPPSDYTVLDADLPGQFDHLPDTGWRRKRSLDEFTRTHHFFDGWVKLGDAARRAEDVMDAQCAADLARNKNADCFTAVSADSAMLCQIKEASTSYAVALAPQCITTHQLPFPIRPSVPDDTAYDAIARGVKHLTVLYARQGDDVLRGLFLAAAVRQRGYAMNEIILRDEAEQILRIGRTAELLMTWHTHFTRPDPRRLLALPPPECRPFNPPT